MTMAAAGGAGGTSGEEGGGSSPRPSPFQGCPQPLLTNSRRSTHGQRTHSRPSITEAATRAAAAAANVNALAGLPVADNSYDELSVIGNGAYGTVYLGRDRNTNQFVALKKVRLSLSDEGVPVSALREISLLKQLEKFEHPHIVRLLDICHGRIERDDRLSLTLVFEYVHQDLDEYMKQCPSPGLDAGRIKSLTHQILCGVDFLHTNRIIHRDLKPQNILVDINHRVKIADFGLARIYDFHMLLTTMVVTLWYRSPEVLLSNSYATPVDIWSCGCIFAELFRKKPIFNGRNEGDQLQRIFNVIGKPLESEWPPNVSLSISNFEHHRGKAWEDVVPEISVVGIDLIQKMLTFCPNSRISAIEALNHPYFNGLVVPRVSATNNRGSMCQHPVDLPLLPAVVERGLGALPAEPFNKQEEFSALRVPSPIPLITSTALIASCLPVQTEHNTPSTSTCSPLENKKTPVPTTESYYFPTATVAQITSEILPSYSTDSGVSPTCLDLFDSHTGKAVVGCESQECSQNLVCNETLLCRQTLACNESLACHETLICSQPLAGSETLTCSENVSCSKVPTCENVSSTNDENNPNAGNGAILDTANQCPSNNNMSNVPSIVGSESKIPERSSPTSPNVLLFTSPSNLTDTTKKS